MRTAKIAMAIYDIGDVGVKPEFDLSAKAFPVLMTHIYNSLVSFASLLLAKK